MKHKVKINIVTNENKRQQLYADRTLSLPKRIVSLPYICFLNLISDHRLKKYFQAEH